MYYRTWNLSALIIKLLFTSEYPLILRFYHWLHRKKKLKVNPKMSKFLNTIYSVNAIVTKICLPQTTLHVQQLKQAECEPLRSGRAKEETTSFTFVTLCEKRHENNSLSQFSNRPMFLIQSCTISVLRLFIRLHRPVWLSEP